VTPDQAAQLLIKNLERLSGETMAINVTRETKATVTATNGGRVLAWTNDKEPNLISVAVPGDRAKLSPGEARELAAYLNEVAAEVAASESERVSRMGTRSGAPEGVRVRVSPWR
jgi:hypothetical protein